MEDPVITAVDLEVKELKEVALASVSDSAVNQLINLFRRVFKYQL
jgi:hypothetical protein